MDSITRRYVAYLNALHNYNAQNGNAFAENNIRSEFFPKVVVEIELVRYIENIFKNTEPHILILSGHAGDGKTSIMYEVLKNLGADFDVDEKIQDVSFLNDKNCCCIRDSSELSEEQKVETLKEILKYPEQGKYVFMVANTGTLINVFNRIFSEADEDTEYKIIEALDKNNGEIIDIQGKKIQLINVAGVDNAYFSKEFLEKITQEELWMDCSSCEKFDYCFIRRNQKLIKNNKNKVKDFIYKNYVWMTEYGTRLTIRSMTEQLAYMITGGYDCDEVKPVEKYKYLFPNLFFGYIGTEENKRADVILAIREMRKNQYDKKRLSADEQLLIKRDYSHIFDDEIGNIILEAEIGNKYLDGWNEFLRRMYIFANIITDERRIQDDTRDVFSNIFERYIAIREGHKKPTNEETALIVDALSMIYLDSTLKKNGYSDIPLTMSRGTGLMQNVQLITGMVPTRRMSVVSEEANGNSFNKDKKRFEMYLKVNGEVLDTILSLPLLDYFNELKKGVIVTNVDPQLTHGVESLKAQLSTFLDDVEDDVVEMIELTNSGNNDIRLDFSNKNRIREAN